MAGQTGLAQHLQAVTEQLHMLDLEVRNAKRERQQLQVRLNSVDPPHVVSEESAESNSTHFAYGTDIVCQIVISSNHEA